MLTAPHYGRRSSSRSAPFYPPVCAGYIFDDTGLLAHACRRFWPTRQDTPGPDAKGAKITGLYFSLSGIRMDYQEEWILRRAAGMVTGLFGPVFAFVVFRGQETGQNFLLARGEPCADPFQPASAKPFDGGGILSLILPPFRIHDSRNGLVPNLTCVRVPHAGGLWFLKGMAWR